ncbi:hypothetical protein CBR_g40810 [Chara braunii]|uniref:Survival of motor neuron-related-splicing factor 30 n=1 Tax=Chara braunii TaxID=69332 RepID=A0A388LUK4_CHABU|nr:hypothetical protein CBR_g40810 [Chara braunii]|eukprot:GBG85997.1 hypothetical protein CBR_g40810 [Chara braunii]
MESVQELESNLEDYRKKLQQANELLEGDPGNEELLEAVKDLQEVIELTEDLLASAKAEELAAASLDDPLMYQAVEATGLPPQPPGHGEGVQNLSALGAKNFIPGEAERADGIRLSQAESAAVAMPSTGPSAVPGWLPPGTAVKAVWSEDGEWYDARIESVTATGYSVVYEEFGNSEEVPFANVKSRIPIAENVSGAQQEVEDADDDIDSMAWAEKEAEAGRQALKRKVEAAAAMVDDMPRSLPAKLRIHPDDSEDVKAAKRRKQHAFKSKVRLERLEVTQNQRQNAWQQFQSARGKQRRVGFFTGRKKESIFKSPDDVKGKVGVTNSGHVMTEFARREKHLHLRVGQDSVED